MYKLQQLVLAAALVLPVAAHAETASVLSVNGKVAFVNLGAGRITVGQSSINASRVELQGVVAGDFVRVDVNKDSSGELFARNLVVVAKAAGLVRGDFGTAKGLGYAGSPVAGIIGTGSQGIIGTGIQGIIGTGIQGIIGTGIQGIIGTGIQGIIGTGIQGIIGTGSQGIIGTGIN